MANNNVRDMQYYKFTEANDSLSGTFEGIVTDPYPLILIDDGGCLYGISLSQSLAEFFQKTKLPAQKAVKLTITFQGQIKTSNNRPFNKFSVAVDDKTLPKNYDKTLLYPTVFDPSTDDIDYATLMSGNFQQEELPF